MKGSRLISELFKKKRIISALLFLALTFGCLTYSVNAWLSYEKRPVVYQFKGTTMSLSLGGTGTSCQLIPGVTHTIANPPTVTMTKGDNPIDYYIFVTTDEVGAYGPNNEALTFGEYVTVNLANPNNWEFLKNGTNDYYSQTNNITEKYVLYYKNGDNNFFSWSQYQGQTSVTIPVVSASFTIKNTVTKEQVAPSVITGNNIPNITFNAYAIQTEGFYNNPEYTTADEQIRAAWAEVEKAINNGSITTLP